MRCLFFSTLFFIFICAAQGIICEDKKGGVFTLITTLYNEKDSERVQEYVFCLEKNIAYGSINAIYVLYDTSKDDKEVKILHYLKTKPVKIRYIDHRPSYQDCFDIANGLPSGTRVIVSNADIYFNETLAHLDRYDFENKFLALTRWNILEDGSLEIFKQYDENGEFREKTSARSHDTWIFQVPLPKFKNVENIMLGTMGCEIAMIANVIDAGFIVLNPCLTIQCCHFHLSGIRNYIRNTAYKISPILNIPWVSLPYCVY